MYLALEREEVEKKGKRVRLKEKGMGEEEKGQQEAWRRGEERALSKVSVGVMRCSLRKD